MAKDLNTGEDAVPATDQAAKKGKGTILLVVLGVLLIAGGTGAGLVLGKRSRPASPETKNTAAFVAIGEGVVFYQKI